MMDPQHYRLKLEQMAAELDEADADGAESSRPVELDQSRVGRLSRMDAMQAQAMSQQAGRRRALMRQRVQAALARIDADEYGCCLNCGEAITPARLEYDPSTPLCMACAERAEQRA